ncbi:TfoX/Sxy family protein [Portibacter lacus]|uniref:TfoX N-terminal domain-containing protein n=1 Tax=Portibacter lacus TaxID=1099794 RepID=A0AA37SIX4_9BACT|nr:TfoX/Sxy family protein [Portibacter lacus]GLR15503.1 hypothetical protein GCM10007940_01180 [Portibacter lacus]
MGIKGDKHTSDSENAQIFLLEQLDLIEGITAKKMFGGYGIFHEGKMFGIVNAIGEIFFKATPELSQKYIRKGSIKHSRMPYYTVPEEILEEDSHIVTWANESIQASK